MKITNIMLVRLMNVLTAYSKKRLPQKISYSIAKNLISLSAEYKIYESQFQKLLEDYGDSILRDDDGNVITDENGVPQTAEDAKEDFDKQLNELLQICVDINIYYIEPSAFDYEDSDRFDTMSAQDIMLLQSILCEDKAESEA